MCFDFLGGNLISKAIITWRICWENHELIRPKIFRPIFSGLEIIGFQKVFAKNPQGSQGWRSLPSEDVCPLHRWPAFGCWRTNLAPGLFRKQRRGHRFGFSTGHPFWGWLFLVMFHPEIKWFGWKGDFSNTCRIICWVRT